MKKILSTVALGVALMTNTAIAEDDIKKTTYKDWIGACVEINGQERCQIQQTLMIEPKNKAEDEDKKGFMVQLTVIKEGDRHFMNVLVPKGVDLRPGVMLQVDQGDQMRVPYATCNNIGCLSIVGIDKPLEELLKKGKEMTIGFIPFGTKDPIGVKASLIGFTEAFKSIK